jgi:hypothetical protein
VKLTIQFHPAPNFITRGAVPPLPPPVFMAWCLIRQVANVTFVYDNDDDDDDDDADYNFNFSSLFICVSNQQPEDQL